MSREESVAKKDVEPYIYHSIPVGRMIGYSLLCGTITMLFSTVISLILISLFVSKAFIASIFPFVLVGTFCFGLSWGFKESLDFETNEEIRWRVKK